MSRSQVFRLIVLCIAAVALSVTALAPVSSAAPPVEEDPSGYAAPQPNGDYVPMSPVRLLDTRNTTKVGPWDSSSIDLKVAGVAGVPSNATAVVLNVTATEATVESFISVRPKGTPRRNASNLNTSTAVPTTANLVIVEVGSGGNVKLYNNAGYVHLIVDIAGYYAADSGFVPSTLVRLVDTRNSTEVGPKSTVELKVTGELPSWPRIERLTHFLPTTVVPENAKAVVLNVTATQPTAESFVTVWPKGTARPNASNLNTSTALPTTANLVIAKVGQHGMVSLYNHAGTVDLIVDIAGYYTAQPTK